MIFKKFIKMVDKIIEKCYNIFVRKEVSYDKRRKKSL